MKEKPSFKRFDLFSILAIVGVALMLVFESFFIFELYETDQFQSVWNRPEQEETVPAAAEPAPAEDPVPESPEEIVPVG